MGLRLRIQLKVTWEGDRVVSDMTDKTYWWARCRFLQSQYPQDLARDLNLRRPSKRRVAGYLLVTAEVHLRIRLKIRIEGGRVMMEW